MLSPLLRSLPYFMSYLIPVITIAGMNMGGSWTFFPIVFVFVLIPVMELLLGSDNSNARPDEEGTWKAHPAFSFLLWGHVVSQTAVLIFFFHFFLSADRSFVEAIGAVLSTGLMLGGIGITVAHELIHRRSPFEQFLGKVLLFSTNYLHFFIEHIRGHHKSVGTDHDPVSAPIGRTFYRFWFRAVAGSFINAWHLESVRMKKLNRPVLSLHNQMLRFFLISIVWNGAIGIAFGVNIFLYYLAASILGFSMLEIVNYIEHYGLTRSQKPDGSFEKVDAHHSWSSNNYLSRWFLFELTRHADHHLNASREYQILRNIDPSPQHPTGYPGMIILALIPPLWFRVMDKKAQAAMGKK